MYAALVSFNSFLLVVVGFFLVRTLKSVDDATEAQILLSTDMKVLIANFQHQTQTLERYELTNAKEHDKFRDDIEVLAERTHELANMVAGLWGVAELEQGWKLPKPPPSPLKPRRK